MLRHRRLDVVLSFLPAAIALAPSLRANPAGGEEPSFVWQVGAHQKIGQGEGGFTGTLAASDEFGSAVANLGDVDGNGISDLAVGAWQDGLQDTGATWILFLLSDGTISGQRKIRAGISGFTGVLDRDDRFGISVAGLGDLDGDGVPDVAVGARHDDDGGTDRGAVWILFLNTNGTVKAHQKISATTGGFGGALHDNDRFGSALAGPGDLDGDGIRDLVVGAPLDDDGGTGTPSSASPGVVRPYPPRSPVPSATPGMNRGALWLVHLNADGTVKARRKISATSGGFAGVLSDGDQFGSALAPLGDFDGDGIGDLAVGARGDDDSGANTGALWILFLTAGGTVGGHAKIASPLGQWEYFFGSAATALGDLDGNGFVDLAVGAPGYRSDVGSTGPGAIALLFLEADASVRHKVSIERFCRWNGPLETGDQFGVALATPGDLDGDGLAELIVGALGDDDGGAGFDRGAIYTAFLEGQRILPWRESQKISMREGGFAGTLEDYDLFGYGLSAIGDLDDDGVTDFAAGAPQAGSYEGAVWILFPKADRTVRAAQEIGEGVGGFAGPLADGNLFGVAVAGLGDVDGDGVEDIAVGAPGDAGARGVVWVLSLNPDGTVKSQRKIGAGQGGFAGVLYDGDVFGWSVVAVGDVDHNGVSDLAVGAPGNDDSDDFEQICSHFCCDEVGAVWILFLDSTGTVMNAHEISAGSGDLPFHLDVDDRFGDSVAALGDLDGDGIVDLAASTPSPSCHDFGPYGAVYVLFLALDGTVRAARRLTEGESGVVGLAPWDSFGSSLASLGDPDGDGTTELAVGVASSDGECSTGATRILHLLPDGTVEKMHKISATAGGFAGELEEGDAFGSSVAAMPDIDGDGGVELLIGAPGDNDGGENRGAVWWVDLGREHGFRRPSSRPPHPR